MKLDNFKGEDAVDIIADVIEPASDIIADPEFQKLMRTGGIPYIKIAVYVLREHKKPILEIYEALEKESKENATPTKLLKLIVDILEDKELSELFFSQGQTEALKSSGSVTENTEDGGN